jgi:hypothetical protein
MDLPSIPKRMMKIPLPQLIRLIRNGIKLFIAVTKYFNDLGL